MPNSKGNTIIGLMILLVMAIGGIFLYVSSQPSDKNTPSSSQSKKSASYNPQIKPEDFSTTITNKYFSLPVGQQLTFEGATKDGPEKIDIKITGETKMIEGVKTLVYLDTVYLNGQTHEVTKDYLAQHKNGDVWYFGEDVDNYEDGKIKDHAGTFLHGKDGAKAGIWMKAAQKVGDSYRQEYYKGQAEDMRNVVAVNQTVTTTLGTYTDCVKVYDWTPLDKKSKEHKYYCPQTGSLVLNENMVTGTKAELTSVIN